MSSTRSTTTQGSPEVGGYSAITDHGIVGDLRSAALVATDGRVDWFCCPRFDSPSVFGALLDTAGGGHWQVHPTDPASSKQFYLPDTNILVTRFSTATGVVEVQDLMPLLRARDETHRQRLVRRIRCVRGHLEVGMQCRPRFDYGRAGHRADEVSGADGVAGGSRVRFTSDDLSLVLSSTVPMSVHDGDATAVVALDAGDVVDLVLDVVVGEEPPPVDVDALYLATAAYWRRWLSRSRYSGRWRETVHRSALTLKLLTHEPSGAVIAAPTTSLPEQVGGGRNWDYRRVWIRDAAFSLYALLRLGFTEEAEAFMGWLNHRLDESAAAAGDAADDAGPLRVMYDIDGRSTGGETTLDHWEGHLGSSPARVGNDAADQLQLDIYGELIDSVYLFNKHGRGISLDTWRSLQGLTAWLQRNWDRPDEGIWEVRGGRRAHTFSRLMCWVALERMIRMARQRGLPGDTGDWERTRDAIFTDILDTCWNPELGAFVQAAGTAVLDASVLLMPMVKFLAPDDPRFTSTLRSLEDALVTDALVFRYDPASSPDGLDGAEGTFSICSFWYVEALTRAGRLQEARLALEKMFTYANPLGLYAEQIGLDGEQLGNFPQAFTHLALISAAINLDHAMG